MLLWKIRKLRIQTNMTIQMVLNIKIEIEHRKPQMQFGIIELYFGTLKRRFGQKLCEYGNIVTYISEL